MRLKSLFIVALATAIAFGCQSCRRQRVAQGGETRITERKVSRGSDRTLRNGGKQVISMRPDKSGVYYVPAKVNGTEMEFVFDTGASVVCLSVVEASFLYRQGKLSKEDFVGHGQMFDATGRVSTNAIINLKDVTIGCITVHNVKASVSESQEAPLLLGQTVLSRFGTVTVDYKHNQIVLEP